MNASGKRLASIAGLLAILSFGAWKYFGAAAPSEPQHSADQPRTTCSDGSGIEALFSLMKQKNTMDPSRPLLWGFFFLDAQRESLAKLQVELEQQGYRAVGIADPASPGDEYMLHVEKEELHTPESLKKRNSELCEIARAFNVLSYDGWDVGRLPADMPPALRDALTAVPSE